MNEAAIDGFAEGLDAVARAGEAEHQPAMGLLAQLVHGDEPAVDVRRAAVVPGALEVLADAAPYAAGPPPFAVGTESTPDAIAVGSATATSR